MVQILTSSRREYYWFSLNRCTGLFLAKNPQNILAINKFFLSMKLSPDTQIINTFFIDIIENLMVSFFITVVFLLQN